MAFFVSSGVTSTSVGLGSGDTLTVLSGGTAQYTQISAGATVFVSAGGLTIFDHISSGGYEVVSSGAVAREITVSAGGAVGGNGRLSGGDIFGSVSGVTLTVDVVSERHVNETFQPVVEAGGVLSDCTIEGPCELQAFAGSDLVSVTVSGNGAKVFQSGSSSDETVVANGFSVLDSGSALRTVVGGGGMFDNDGGVDSGTVVSSGGGVVLHATTSALTVYSGGVAVMETLSGSVVGVAVSGGVLSAENGILSSASVVSGGLLGIFAEDYVQGDLAISDTTVFQGGTLEIDQADISFAAVVLSSSYTSAVVSGVLLAGGSLTFRNVGVDVGGVLSQLAGTHTSYAYIASGGALLLDAGAQTSAVNVASGGVLEGSGEVLGGQQDNVDRGLVSGMYLGGSSDGPAGMLIESGGTADHVIEASVGGQLVVMSGGLALRTVVGGSDNRLLVEEGGGASRTVLARSGASELDLGVSVEALVSRGGLQVVELGGAASATSLGDGGALVVSSGGVATRTAVGSGGVLTLRAGGVATDVTETLGGVIIDGGALTYTTAASLSGSLAGGGVLVEDGPGKLVLNAASSTGFHGEVLLSAGTVELARKGETGSAGVVFDESGRFATLQIDAADMPASGATFATTLSNFDNADDRIDLAGLAFTSGAKAAVKAGVLTLTDGGYTAKFTLTGTQASKYVVVSDGSSGTLIHAAVGAATQSLRQAMATFDAGGAATASTMSAHDLQSARIGLAAEGVGGSAKHELGQPDRF